MDINNHGVCVCVCLESMGIRTRKGDVLLSH